MRVQLTAEEFRVLEGALDAADPGPGKDGDAPVPQEVITAIRYKLLDAESSRNYGLDLTGEEVAVLHVCFNVGSEILHLPDETYRPIVSKLAPTVTPACRAKWPVR